MAHADFESDVQDKRDKSDEATDLLDTVTAPSRHLGAVEGTTSQVIQLPPPPTPEEDAAAVFDPWRDITPG